MQIAESRRLLELTALLAERYRAKDRYRFNVFSVLRTATDEVNLHSRFLAALLQHRKSADEPMFNLCDFLCDAGRIEGFSMDGAEVLREYQNIDILIRNEKAKEVVIIENKIWAGDQDRQLARYAEQFEREGYGAIHLLYLTLDGRAPDEASAQGHNVRRVSYDEIVPWLKRCQQRAYDEPGLRETVAQYVRLVKSLTGTDIGGTYMNELKSLILKNDNLLHAYDLAEALVEAKVSLLNRLWEEIDSEVRFRFADVPARKTSDSDVSQDIWRSYLTRSKGVYPGLLYEVKPGVALAIGVDMGNTYIQVGIQCPRETHEAEHDRLATAFANDRPHGTDSWPWWDNSRSDISLRHLTRNNLALLNDEGARRDYAKEIVDSLRSLWDKVKDRVLQ